MEVMLTEMWSLSVSQVFLQLYILSLEDLGRQMYYGCHVCGRKKPVGKDWEAVEAVSSAEFCTSM